MASASIPDRVNSKQASRGSGIWREHVTRAALALEPEQQSVDHGAEDTTPRRAGGATGVVKTMLVMP
jgi:hypothetical protein